MVGSAQAYSYKHSTSKNYLTIHAKSRRKKHGLLDDPILYSNVVLQWGRQSGWLQRDASVTNGEGKGRMGRRGGGERERLV